MIRITSFGLLIVYVQSGVYDELVAKLIEKAKASAIGTVSRLLYHLKSPV